MGEALGVLGALFEFSGSLFSGGSPFHGSAERPASFWLARLLGVALFFAVIAAVWYTYLRAV